MNLETSRCVLGPGCTTRYGFPLIGAIENMQIYYAPQQREIVDVFALTAHDTLWREDLTRLREAGSTLVRYPIPWFRIEQLPGEYDWQWLDEVLAFARDIGLEIIADPCHMKSFPLWLQGGFLNPAFPELYLCFVQRLSDRYPHLTHWTAFNEPLTTAIMWGRNATWHLQGNSDATFVCSLVNIVRGWSLAANFLRQEPGNVLIQAEPMEFHGAWPSGHPCWEEQSADLAQFHIARSFVATDLGLGRVDREHEMWPFLRHCGLSEREAEWFREHPAPVDILGWDYYAHTSEHFWQAEEPGWSRPGPHPLGLLENFKRYIERYPGYDVMLTETNLPGRVEDRMVWLRYVLSECIGLQAWLAEQGRPERFTGLCWFPSFDSHSWSISEMASVTQLDPTGIWWLDPDLQRHSSQLSELWGALARGEVGLEAIPLYSLNPVLASHLRGYQHLLPPGTFGAAQNAQCSPAGGRGTWNGYDGMYEAPRGLQRQ